MVLLEETHVDGETGRIVHPPLADYLVPVNADAPDIQMDHRCQRRAHLEIRRGPRGIGELPMVGVAAVWRTPYITRPVFGCERFLLEFEDLLV